MTKTKKKENKFIKGLKFLGKVAYQVLRVAAGSYTTFSGVVTFNPVVAWNGIEAISNVICATVKDNPKNSGSAKSKIIKGSMAIFNLLANNIGKASNDPKLNK